MLTYFYINVFYSYVFHCVLKGLVIVSGLYSFCKNT